MNSTNVIIMLLVSSAERKSMSKEMGFDEPRFLALVDDALDDQEYSFLTINLAEKKSKEAAMGPE